MRFELPSKVSNNSYHSGFNHGKYTVELGSSDEWNYNTDASCKSFQTSSMKIIRDLSAETDCKTAAEIACDLHLRLGPSSNPSSNTATNGSCDIEDFTDLKVDTELMELVAVWSAPSIRLETSWKFRGCVEKKRILPKLYSNTQCPSVLYKSLSRAYQARL